MDLAALPTFVLSPLVPVFPVDRAASRAARSLCVAVFDLLLAIGRNSDRIGPSADLTPEAFVAAVVEAEDRAARGFPGAADAARLDVAMRVTDTQLGTLCVCTALLRELFRAETRCAVTAAATALRDALFALLYHMRFAVDARDDDVLAQLARDPPERLAPPLRYRLHRAVRAFCDAITDARAAVTGPDDTTRPDETAGEPRKRLRIA